MKVFADTTYWLAIINPQDQLHHKATELTKNLNITQFVTTDEVLIELLAFCSNRGHRMRTAGVAIVRDILGDAHVTVFPQTRQTFLEGLALYEQRQDKQYSLTDCISMNAMRASAISHALTSDVHFAQEGFTKLL